MSYGTRKRPIWRKAIGFLLFAAFVIPLASFSFMVWAIGRCDSDGFCTPLWNYLLMFPGLLIAAIVCGVFVVRWAAKDDY
jgi:hypothetical protein